jgi:acyl-CoA reductase-like NAD-dependent aldehyde dehydrogenase
MAFATVNPATGETLRTYEPHSAKEVERRIHAAADAYLRHRRTSFAERARMMLRAAEILESEREEFGRLMVTEMGKPIQAARDEAAKSALGCRYYAEHAERFLADEPVATNAAKSWVAYQPIGPVLAIMPWNFPFWQVFRFAAPAPAAACRQLRSSRRRRSAAGSVPISTLNRQGSSLPGGNSPDEAASSSSSRAAGTTKRPSAQASGPERYRA